MKIINTEHTILEVFADYAALGTTDNLTDEEVQAFDQYTEQQPDGFEFWHPTEDTFFGTCDVTGLKGTCTTMLAFIREAA
jgi:hypothetical protein